MIIYTCQRVRSFQVSQTRASSHPVPGQEDGWSIGCRRGSCGGVGHRLFRVAGLGQRRRVRLGYGAPGADDHREYGRQLDTSVGQESSTSPATAPRASSTARRRIHSRPVVRTAYTVDTAIVGCVHCESCTRGNAHSSRHTLHAKQYRLSSLS